MEFIHAALTIDIHVTKQSPLVLLVCLFVLLLSVFNPVGFTFILGLSCYIRLYYNNNRVFLDIKRI